MNNSSPVINLTIFEFLGLDARMFELPLYKLALAFDILNISSWDKHGGHRLIKQSFYLHINVWREPARHFQV